MKGKNMRFINLKTLGGLIMLFSLSHSTHAALVSRFGGAAYYDTASDLTWITDANLALSKQFGLTLGTGSNDETPNIINANGRMTWDNANAWIAGMNNANYLGFGDWRLPTVTPINGTAFNSANSHNGSTDQGRNISRPGTLYAGSLASEVAYLFYNTLGNVSDYSVAGLPVDSCPHSVSCLSNHGPFTNFSTSDANRYWSGHIVDTNSIGFELNTGLQYISDVKVTHSILAVRSGDVAAVPVPAALWLMGSAMLALIGFNKETTVASLRY